jgi:hypothetical protein
MKKQKFWTRVRNVFRPDKNNGLTNDEIAHLNQLKDKKDFQDLLFEPLQMYQLLCKKYTNTEVMRWICEVLEFEGDELDETSQTMEFLTQLNHVARKQQWDKMQNLFALVHEICEVAKASKTRLPYKSITKIKGSHLSHRYPKFQEIEATTNAQVHYAPNGTNLTQMNPTEVIEAEQKEIDTKPTAEVKTLTFQELIDAPPLPLEKLEQKEIDTKPTVKYGYKHPLAKGKIYSTKLFQDAWEVLPDYFTRQSAEIELKKYNVGSGAFLNTLIQNTFKDGLLSKPKYGYYEKVHPKNKIVNEPLEALIEEEKEVELKITLEKSKEPIRKLYPVPYNREEGNDVYGLRDYITLDNAQKVFGLNKRYVLNLVNYKHILDVGKTLIDNKWMCVLNYHELKGYCERKQNMADSVGYAKNCESCNNTFNAWSEHLNYCRSCISKL